MPMRRSGSSFATLPEMRSSGQPRSMIRLFTCLCCRVIINWGKGVVVKVGAPSVHEDLQQIVAIQERLPGPVVLLIGAAAAIVSLPPLWLASRYLYKIGR